MSLKTLFVLCANCIFIGQCQQENPIKHLIILMMENRSFDHYLGWLKQLNPLINGLTGNEYNCIIPDNTSSTCVTVSQDGYNTGPDDPDHSFGGTADEIYGHTGVVEAGSNIPKMNGFVYQASKNHHDITNVMKMFSIDNTSSHVLNTLAMDYGIFDNWFCSVPGPTDPNRAFAMSGTSNGMVDDYNGTKWNQQSYFDLLTKNNISWAGYWYASVWALAYFDDLTKTPNSEHIHPFSQFYTDLNSDNLASYIWLQPTGSSTNEYGPANWQHPDASVEVGETFIQKVYESLKNSSYWNSSALIITYDEHGGFYDHVAPPQTSVPPPDGVKNSNGFKFDRLGIRIPTVVVSPWINKGTIIHNATNGPQSTSQYEGCSNMATANKLFNLDKYLGDRHKWAATFDHIFLDRQEPRTDSPLFPPIKPWTEKDVELQAKKPINDALQTQVQFICDEMNIKPCPKFEKQGEASEFLVAMMPNYIKKIQS